MRGFTNLSEEIKKNRERFDFNELFERRHRY